MHKKVVVIAFTLLLALSSISTFASEGSGEEMPGKDMNGQILSDPIEKETTPLQVTNTSFGHVKLSWPKDPSGTGYIVYRYDTLLQRYEPIKAITDRDITTYTDKKVEENVEYHYQITPILAKVERKNSRIVSIKTASVKPEVHVSVKGNGAKISWTTIDGATGYEVYRSTSSDGKYVKMGSTTDPEYKDEGLEKGGTYFYKVRAYQDDAYTSFSAPAETGEIGKEDLVWPFPATRSISCGFGPRVSPTGGASTDHKGIDLAAPAGSDVLAAQSGTVIESSYNGLSGNYLVVAHDNGMVTRYHHLSQAKVSVGDKVKAGQTIALSGNTGVSTGAHLHFELHVDGAAVDPMKYL
jgi:murein DD-endopeptidase MepM/ murein hydrolase activator NlpD